MPTSRPLLSKPARPAAAAGFRFWFVLALPIAGPALAVLPTNVSAAGVSSAIVEVAGAAI